MRVRYGVVYAYAFTIAALSLAFIKGPLLLQTVCVQFARILS